MVFVHVCNNNDDDFDTGLIALKTNKYIYWKILSKSRAEKQKTKTYFCVGWHFIMTTF